MTTSNHSALYVYHLPKQCSEIELKNVFETYGPVHSINLYKNQEKPFAALVYVNPEDADRARVQLNGCVFMGRKIRITRAPQPDSQGTSNNTFAINSIYVRFTTTNTEVPVTVEDLEHIFQTFGKLEDVSIKISSTDQRKGIQSGYAFVHFVSNEQGVQSAIKAVATMDGNVVENIKFKVELSRNLLKQFEAGKEADRTKSCRQTPSPSASAVNSPGRKDEATLPSPSYAGQWDRQINNDSNDWRSRRVHSVGNMPPPVMVTQFSPSTRQEDGRWLGDHYQQQQQASVTSSPYGMMPNNGMPSPYLGAPSPRGSSNTSMMRPPQPPASLSLAPVGPTGYQPSSYVSSEVGMRGWLNNTPSQSPSAFYSSPGLSGSNSSMGNRSANVNGGLLQQSVQTAPYQQSMTHRAQAVTALSTLTSHGTPFKSVANSSTSPTFVSTLSSACGATTASRSCTPSHDLLPQYSSPTCLDGDISSDVSKLSSWSVDRSASPSPTAALASPFNFNPNPANHVSSTTHDHNVNNHFINYANNDHFYFSGNKSTNYNNVSLNSNHFDVGKYESTDTDRFPPSTLSSMHASGSNLAHNIWESPVKSLFHPRQQSTCDAAGHGFHQSSFTISPGLTFPDSLSSIDDILDDEA
eukprot:gene6144-6766_t